jgi:hypothetical protein
MQVLWWKKAVDATEIEGKKRKKSNKVQMMNESF